MFENWMIWAILAIVFFIVEVGTPTAFFFACLGLGAAFASASTFFHIAWLPWTVFVAFSLGFIIASRPLANKIYKSPARPANVDALMNQKAYVLEDISPKKFGRVKIEGEEWLAESTEEIKKSLVLS